MKFVAFSQFCSTLSNIADLTVQDMIDRNVSIYYKPGMEIWKHVMSKMPSPYPELAERIYIASSWEEFNNITKYDLVEKGTHAQVVGYLKDYELEWAKEQSTAWYRSKERVPIKEGFLGGGPISNKKWPLNENLLAHLLRLQQSGITFNEVVFTPELFGNTLEPLRMEHFYFPFVILVTGLVFSSLGFMIEIIVKNK